MLRRWLSFVPTAPEIPTSKFSGVLNSMAKVWKLYHSPFLRYPTAFFQNIFLLRKWLSFIPSVPVIPTSKFSGVLNTMAKVWKLYHSLFLTHSTAFSQNMFLLRKWLSFIPRTPVSPYKLVFRGAEHNGKGLKALTFTVSEIIHCIFSKHVLA